jgi:hypothetical protein
MNTAEVWVSTYKKGPNAKPTAIVADVNEDVVPVEVTSVSADSHEPESPFRHFLCLDMVQIDLELNGCHLSDCAILLEVWERGGMLQTSVPIPERSSITLRVNQRVIAAEISACRRDQNFGFLIDVNVDAPRMWFPHGYVPAWRLPAFA